jgi:hypothetical protein
VTTPDDSSRRVIFGPAPPRRPATDARLRAMARQLKLARGEIDDDAGCPLRAVLMGLARRALPVGDQVKLLGMANEGEETTW